MKPRRSRLSSTQNVMIWGTPIWLQWTMMIAPPMFWAIVVLYSRFANESFRALTKEDGLIENLQVFVLVLAAVFCLRAAPVLIKSGATAWAIIYAALAIGLVWVAGEEISWGQRLFGIATPQWFESHNMQGELNLHNLPTVMSTMHRVVNVMLVVAIPVCWYVWIHKRGQPASWQFQRWVPHPILIPTWFTFLSYTPLRLHKYIGSRAQEPSELILFLGIAFFCWQVMSFERRKLIRDES